MQRRTPNRRSAYWPVLGYFMLSSVKPTVGKLAEKASTSLRSAVTPCAQQGRVGAGAAMLATLAL